MKFDFSDFFHSIRAEDWTKYCEFQKVFSRTEDVEYSAKLFFQKSIGGSTLRLAIGAPSSPWLSNVLMYDFDDAVSKAVEKDKITYTRYADDLTFSARRTGYLTIVERALRKVVREIPSPRLAINEDKTVVATTKYRRVVTGLVLADDGRVTIGRDRKRFIRAAIHHAFSGRRSAADNARLAGLIAFAGDIEPEFLASLKQRYGTDFLKKLSKPGDED